jgi:DNA-binding MarR family transcriptional regulator
MAAKKEVAGQVAKIDLGALEDSVAFALRRAQNASFQSFATLTGDRRLRPGQYALLQLIRDNPDMTQTDLGNAIGRDMTTLTLALQSMEKDGSIVRVRHPNDGRSRIIRLTAKGSRKLEVLGRCAERHDARVDALVGADKQHFLKILRRLALGLESEGRQKEGA